MNMFSKKDYWKNKYNKYIKISDMSINYINNCIDFINNKIATAYNRYYDTDFEIPDYVNDKLDEFYNELEKRK